MTTESLSGISVMQLLHVQHKEPLGYWLLHFIMPVLFMGHSGGSCPLEKSRLLVSLFFEKPISHQTQ